MEGDASGKNVAFTLQDNEASIVYIGKMDCNSRDTNFAFMTCSGSALCCRTMWAEIFGDDVYLQIWERLWPKKKSRTSGNVFPCGSYGEPGRPTTGGPFCPGLTVLLELAASGRTWQPLQCGHVKPALAVMGRPWINDASALD
ncbi:unnamed protein product [Symbiodinium sp. CCMP2592]|nr:unnamed protein product [Symbiodinium sp. CCMP2592]